MIPKKMLASYLFKRYWESLKYAKLLKPQKEQLQLSLKIQRFQLIEEIIKFEKYMKEKLEFCIHPHYEGLFRLNTYNIHNSMITLLYIYINLKYT